MKANFASHLETKIPKCEGRAERLWNPTLLEVRCEVSASGDEFRSRRVIWVQSQSSCLPENLKSTSCFPVMKSCIYIYMPISFPSSTWHRPTSKRTASCLDDRRVTVLVWSANRSDPNNPVENLWVIAKRRNMSFLNSTCCGLIHANEAQNYILINPLFSIKMKNIWEHKSCGLGGQLVLLSWVRIIYSKLDKIAWKMEHSAGKKLKCWCVSFALGKVSKIQNSNQWFWKKEKKICYFFSASNDLNNNNQ